VRAVTGDAFIPENLILPQGVVPLCEDSRLRTAVLATLPTLDDGGLAACQTGGDPNRGVRIPGASGDQAVSSIVGSGPTAKGKRGDGTLVGEPAAKHQRSTEDAGQGSSRAPGHRGTSEVDAPSPSPPRDTSPR